MIFVFLRLMTGFPMIIPKSFVLLILLSLPLPLRAQPSDVNSFSFLTGSCAHLDIAQQDSTGILYKGDTSIFYRMSMTPADFMLWLGDNWYLDAVDWNTAEGLRKKATEVRTSKVMQKLADRPFPEYAIWDDHDFGPNQSAKDYPLKHENRRVFIDTWTDNPSFGERNEGIYTSFRVQDVRFILLDDRWWRDKDKLWPYILWRPNPRKRMFGKQQMDWLKRQLLADTSAGFKIIIGGSQMMNPWSETDGFVHYPLEYNNLLRFIRTNNIKGVVFMSGDKHYSEIIRKERKNNYPLYDITVSPLTSSPSEAKGTERINKYRVPGSLIETYNFASISFSGAPNQRKLTVDFYDKKGKLLFNWSVNETALAD
jgi:alkaline phosphatase D